MEELKSYTLKHRYLVDEIYIESKFIGVFSSWEEADKAIDIFFVLPGFKDYPRDCFIIKEYIVNDYDKWKDGFKEEQLDLLYWLCVLP
ncbi:hypothetical protein [Bacteroides sp. 519]|uniref:DUF7336 domain-containing protein n=1 Tax=Bacteroides sp. 519 TaxID=2302937 RepID=UPI0013D2BE72|nr:hypothetical protein [Bacteroides sp. 519]NDV58951.1 hypothetical protein [Bacteroides sp. 519]